MKKYVIAAMLLLVVLTSCVNQNGLDPKIKEIKDRGKLIVGSDIPYGVMEFFDESGKAVGIDVDIAQEIADYLGVELEFRATAWDLLFDDVKSGEIDIAMSSITITPERAEEMLFSIPYFNAGQVLVVAVTNEEINGPIDLDGKKVGVQTETTGEIEAKRYTTEELVVPYQSYECIEEKCMLDDLKNGEIDAIILDYVAAIDIVHQDEDLKIVGEPFTDEFYGIVTSLENTALIEEVNTVLRELKRTGKLQEIIDMRSN